MANHYSHASLPYPIRGAKFTLQVPFANPYAETPAFVTKISKDNGAIADATEEVVQITGTNSGIITLTATEMTAALVILSITAVAGQEPTQVEILPRNLQSIVTGTASAGAAGTITLAASASGYENAIVLTTGGTGSGQARMIKSVSGNVCTVAENWETNPDATTTYAILRTEFMAGSTSTPPTVGEIADAVWDEALSAHTTAGSGGKILADAATAAALATVDDFIDTEVAAILAAVDTEVATVVTQTSAASIRTAVGLASANLDTQISTLATASALSTLSGTVTTIANRIGAFTGSGVNTILGFLRVLFRKDSIGIPSDIGGTFDNLTDSIEAIRDQGDAAWITNTAASIRSAVGLASANLDSQLLVIQTDTTTDIPAQIAALPTAPTATQNADALLDRASAIDGKTPREALRIIGATTAGKVSGAGTGTEVFVGLDGVTARVTGTVTAAGNRTDVVYS